MSTIAVNFEATPNPATYKFVINQTIAPASHDYRDARDTDTSPLAGKIFGFPWTSGVFIGPDFVTITKQDWVDWETLAEPLAGLIREHLERGEPVLVEASSAATGVAGGNEIRATDSPEVARIKQILNDEIRPAVAMDGGDIVFHDYKDHIVYLRMHGSCSGCPSSTMTLKMGIEARLKGVLPEIVDVVAV